MEPQVNQTALLKQMEAAGILPTLQAAFREFPSMPFNSQGLRNGDVIQCTTDELGSFAKQGQEFPIFYDGESIRCSPPAQDGSMRGPSWSPEQLCSEIAQRGWWKVSGNIYDGPATNSSS